MLCLREGRNDPQGLERVLPVLDRRLYDGGDGGVVFYAGLRAEASADLEFGLGRPERLLAVVVRGRNGRVGEEGEDVAPMFVNALLEFIQFGLPAVFPCVDGRPGEQFVQAFLHLRPHILPDVPLMPLVDGVPQEVKHVHAPGVIRKGLRRVSEVPQQVGDADLVVFHTDVSHEVTISSLRITPSPTPSSLMPMTRMPTHMARSSSRCSTPITGNTAICPCCCSRGAAGSSSFPSSDRVGATRQSTFQACSND